MSIAQKQPKGTLTEPSRALALFTDRTDALRLFAGRIHADPAVEKVIFFYGDGGNGKTLLLRWLQANACKLLPPRTWERVRAIGDDAAFRAAFVEAEGATVPYAVLDFGATPQGVNRPQEGFYALLMLRRQLAACGLTFPLFDFAVLWYLKETKQLTTEEVHSLFPGDALDLIDALLGTVTSLPWFGVGKALLNLFDKRLGERFTLYRKQRGLPEEEVTRIARLPANPDLLDLLPELFALDLNAAMQLGGAPERLALFFDTHEALWGAQRNLADAAYFARDAWLRRFLCHLDLNADVTVVVAGRDRPRWPEAAETPIPTDYLDPHLVGHLSPADATDYLTRAGVADPDLRRHLAAYTTGHPYYLGLCADIVVAAGERGENLTAPDFEESSDLDRKGRQLVERLLKWVDDDTEHAVRALCAARSFDWDVYAHLAHELHFAATEPAFKRLTQFSFVQPLPEAGKPRYRMHELLRRLLDDPVRQRAHVALEGYYRGHADELERVEAIYHLNQRDAEGSWDELYESLEGAVEGARWALCERLAEVRRVLTEASFGWSGSVLRLEADYLTELSRYAEAEARYVEGTLCDALAICLAPEDPRIHAEWGTALLGLAGVEATLGQTTAAAGHYELSVEAYDRALQASPNYVGAHTCRGNALLRLGQLKASLRHEAAAAASYAAAVAAYDRALQLAPDDVAAHNGKGCTLALLGKSQAVADQLVVAAASYGAALTAFDRALQLAPELAGAHNNRGNVLHSLGDLQMTLKEHEAAAGSYRASLAAYDQALQLAPNSVRILYSKGNVLCDLAYLRKTLEQYAEAEASYTLSICAYDRALQLAPDYVDAHGAKSVALRALGALYYEQGRLDEADVAFRAASDEYDQVLILAPNRIEFRRGPTAEEMFFGAFDSEETSPDDTP